MTNKILKTALWLAPIILILGLCSTPFFGLSPEGLRNFLTACMGIGLAMVIVFGTGIIIKIAIEEITLIWKD